MVNIPLSVARGSHIMINLDSDDSPATYEVDALDSPARKELQTQLEKLQSKLSHFIKKVKK